jgi:hypothetical protein
MRQFLKDQWVLASDVRTHCSRGGDYTREVLEEAATCGLVEKKEESKPKIYYKIDPPPGHDEPICPFEPGVPYKKSICAIIENEIEDCIASKYENQPDQSDSCGSLARLRRRLFPRSLLLS